MFHFSPVMINGWLIRKSETCHRYTASGPEGIRVYPDFESAKYAAEVNWPDEKD